MATTTKTLIHWVLCDDYAAGPYTPETAATQAAKVTPKCRLDHRVVTSGTKPVTATDIAAVRAEWDEPFLADPSDESASAARRELKLELAGLILGAELMTRVGGLTITSAGWSKERGDAADSAAEVGSPEWMVALGDHEHATLTEDGRSANREAWCTCPEPKTWATLSWVRYEGWTAEGMVAHGFVCGSCRRITQSG